MNIDVSLQELLAVAAPRPWHVREDDDQIDVMSGGDQVLLVSIEGDTPAQLDGTRADARLAAAAVNITDEVINLAGECTLMKDLSDCTIQWPGDPKQWCGACLGQFFTKKLATELVRPANHADPEERA